MRFWREMYILHSKALVSKIKSTLFPLIFRCIEKDPINRYFTFKELRKDLELILKRQTGEIIKPPIIEELDALDLFKKGISFIAMQKWQEALKCHGDVIEIDPLNERAWYNKGYALEKLEKWHEAIECYDKALELDPSINKIWKQKGDIVKKLGNLEDALFCYDKAYEANPNSLDYSQYLTAAKANLFELLHEYHEAIKCYDKILESNPTGPWEAWLHKGLDLMKLNNVEGAINALDNYIKYASQDAGNIMEVKKLIRDLNERRLE